MLGSVLMRVTTERVAIGIVLTVLLATLLTYFEKDATLPRTMITLHTIERRSRDTNTTHIDRALRAVAGDGVRTTVGFSLRAYTFADATRTTTAPIERRAPFPFPSSAPSRTNDLRDRERSAITVCSDDGTTPTRVYCSVGVFDVRHRTRQAAAASLALTLFVVLVWCVAVLSYAMPVSTLIASPIERMVRCVGFLVRDPLGYQNKSDFHQFVMEEDEILKMTWWKKDVIDGMETSFLMSTIIRISSLLGVGFGSAGVEIIRSNLDARNDVVSFENLGGLIVHCVFVFGDIRRFTDVSECLQEEIFGFTNRIASVVHAFCSSYGGSANKNIGDAFLMSWKLEDSEEEDEEEEWDKQESMTTDGFDGGLRMHGMSDDRRGRGLVRRRSGSVLQNYRQADKALLAVVRIFVNLQHDCFYLKDVGRCAKKRLEKKMSDQEGPFVKVRSGSQDIRIRIRLEISVE